MLRFVNKRLDFVETGIVCFAIYSRGGDPFYIWGLHEDAKIFPVTRKLQVIIETRVVVFEIERRLRVAVFSVKTSTYSWSFTFRIDTMLCSTPRETLRKV